MAYYTTTKHIIIIHSATLGIKYVQSSRDSVFSLSYNALIFLQHFADDSITKRKSLLNKFNFRG